MGKKKYVLKATMRDADDSIKITIMQHFSFCFRLQNKKNNYSFLNNILLFII